MVKIGDIVKLKYKPEAWLGISNQNIKHFFTDGAYGLVTKLLTPNGSLFMIRVILLNGGFTPFDGEYDISSEVLNAD